jgi:hypothetical protein
MHEIRTRIDIEAPRDAIWSVLTDFAAYPEWNPFLVRVETTPTVGAPVGLTVRVAGRTLPFEARMLSVTPGRQFRWAGPLSGVQAAFFRGEHYFVVDEVDTDRCRFIHGEEFTGLLVPLAGWWLTRSLTPSYQAFNEALKRRAEARVPARTTG